MKLVAIITFFILTISAFAQPPSIQWEKTYGGGNDDEFISACNSDDGSIVFIGYTASTGGYIINHHGGRDVWILKMDQLGNIIWNNCYGGIVGEEGYSVTQTYDGGFVIAADAIYNDGDVSGVNGVRDDYWIIKTDSISILEWKKCYGGTDSDNAKSIIQTKDSSYLIVGESHSFDIDVIGNHGMGDVWALKINRDSSIQWSRAFGGNSRDAGVNQQICVETIDGNYLIVSNTVSNNGDVSGHHNYFAGDAWVIKVSSSGQLLWQRCYGGYNIDNGNAILNAPDKGFYVAGNTGSTDGDVSSLIGGQDFWVFRADSTGAIIWEKCYGGTNTEIAYNMCSTLDGGLAIAGRATLNGGQVSGTHGSNDIWVIKIDSSGTFEWGKSLGGSDIEDVNAIVGSPGTELEFAL